MLQQTKKRLPPQKEAARRLRFAILCAGYVQALLLVAQACVDVTAFAQAVCFLA